MIYRHSDMCLKYFLAHDYVPWVLVDNTLLSNTNLLIVAICKAYTGPQPESCRKAEKALASPTCAN